LSYSSAEDEDGLVKVPNLTQQIRILIADTVSAANTRTRYRDPLLAFTRADDPGFDQLPDLIPDHLHPRDLLPEARSVCAFFLPFDPQVVRSNRPGKRGSPWASETWARAYVETNALLSEICRTLGKTLAEQGIRAAWQPPTHNFDPVRLISAWSHKSVAAVARLGHFGHHQMLITRAGCAGRFSSIVLDVDPPLLPGDTVRESLCLYDKGCRICVRRCPVGALTEEGFDRQICYARCLENDTRFLQWLADVCGKCATGPCATIQD
jgi:epoxyqueuosine reductase QueG